MNHNTAKYILIGIVACLAGALIGVGAFSYFINQQQPIPATQEQTVKKSSDEQQPLETSKIIETPKSDSAKSQPSGITWLPMPEKISVDLGLISIEKKPEDQRNFDDYIGVEYYRTGSVNGMNIIIAEISQEMAFACSIENCKEFAFFEQRADGYALIVKMSSRTLFDWDFKEEPGKYLGPPLTKMVTSIDRIKEFQDIGHPKDFTTYGEATFTTTNEIGVGFIPEADFYTKNMTKVADVTFGTLYSSVSPIFYELPGVASQRYYVRKLNGMAMSYNHSPKIIGDDFVLKAIWNDGSKNTEAYQEIATGGCGNGGGTPILQNNSLNRLVKTGSTSLGPVYEFKDSDAPLLKSIYEIVKGNPDALPYKTWLTKHPVIAFKDALGRVILYNNTTYGPNVECGKPVIYLYPQTPTNVNLVVGANIRISEPPYDNGWTVRANPDGSLITSDGAHYGSLFWEGLGHGVYPEIKSGFIVAQDEVEQTLRAHLARLGLNEKESAEFLEFWLPRMPNTPYIRLSWFGTREMNALAPLTITPKPDTVIRIFLDFEGLEQSLAIEPQRLTSVPRKGFTVVEWGGILRK